MSIYDIIIIGAGPAGLSAAVYSARYRLKTLVFGELVGGKVGEAWKICNFLSYGEIKGSEFVDRMSRQVEKLGVEIKQEAVTEIKKSQKVFEIKTQEGSYFGKKIILAMGSEKRKLGLKDEGKFFGKGLTYCAACDAPLYKNKIVAVIGGGNSALTSALLLSEYAKKIFIIYRQDKFFRADPAWVEAVKKNKKIEPIFNSEVAELVGGKNLEAVKLKDKKILEIQGLFIETGAVPNAKLVEQLGVATEKGFIKTDRYQKTNIAGVYAAGDITDNPLKQIITAAAEGAVAASTAYKENTN